MYQTTYEEVVRLNSAGEYKRIPVYKEMLSDFTTPVEVLKKLQNVSSHCFMLESIEDKAQWGRYTFIGYDPVLELTCIDHKLTIKRKNAKASMKDETIEELEVEHPGVYIRQIIEDNRAPRLKHLPPMSGGLVGYFAYDYIKYSEPSLNLDAEDVEGFMDVDLMLFDKVIVFDNFRQQLFLIVNIGTDSLPEEFIKAMVTLKKMEEIIRCGQPKKAEPGRRLSEFRSLFDQGEYCEKVERAKHYIREGDIFQVVLSNRLEADFGGSLLDAYRILRTTNPSPYMFYFSSNDIEMAGASPETLVKVMDREVSTFPLAGTRPRGNTYEHDRELEQELLADEKELAEHNMLVDLGRNDLGRICEFGSVNVSKYQSVERFSHVMHIGSTITGKLREENTALDAIDAVLPAGTLSGAPKIRACQIINELENNKRGIYGGAIGYLDLTGNMDTCIAIRLAFKKNGKVFVRSGAGIVADSVAENEYQECLNKAKAVLQALEEAKEVTDI